MPSPATPLATEQGKEAAIAALKARREASKNTRRINNADLPAGYPMYFYCESCGFTMTYPENYTTRESKCDQCRAMLRHGWPLD
jgi:transcription initiation factor IIE alpha subunit